MDPNHSMFGRCSGGGDRDPMGAVSSAAVKNIGTGISGADASLFCYRSDDLTKNPPGLSI